MLRLLCLTLPFVSTHGFGDSRLDACEQAGGISGFQGDLANLKKTDGGATSIGGITTTEDGDRCAKLTIQGPDHLKVCTTITSPGNLSGETTSDPSLIPGAGDVTFTINGAVVLIPTAGIGPNPFGGVELSTGDLFCIELKTLTEHGAQVSVGGVCVI
uniref:Uncharacterized protein n=1 Tax=Aureoumbra lagunensis TaxID=44058 RepID=A0A6S8AN38_9STRA|mmetsp:Transcript_19637/g.25429  ORF Transcript_19637/g.25429 Transcript_19637/m.25429 type:complete len:158 (+) Transcript_19637:187-660(+)|eukprot:CAMPEP_0197286096 /NCGR_PEP_ID=MMETSP0890-20130614/1531_1 /TAXON_ID=44058 ORGANISM="Aureoumbra lagunensis, Strain CCMP1510" /NCGR_SAMPLE_ID=MMETSP0890 /ASSEMBLY_ACC=CAM_ASM_000533 /LENGTH=157 /DNA_ID=CAMNT_0042754211 /DNA_START=172 /DNA_END=645 /DNA_ORIENTATION=-